MKTLANGVAVYPTYWARGISFSRLTISRLTAVRSEMGWPCFWALATLSGLTVFTVAWSDSSSMIRTGMSLTEFLTRVRSATSFSITLWFFLMMNSPARARLRFSAA